MELNFVLKLVSGLNIKEIIIVRMKTTIVDVIGMGEIVVEVIHGGHMNAKIQNAALIQIIRSPNTHVGHLRMYMITLVMMKTTTVDVIGMVEIVVETKIRIHHGAQNVLALIQITKNVNKNHLFNCNDILGI